MSEIVLRILVADDELLARKRLLRLLGAIDAVTVVGECEDGPAVLERVRQGGVDVVLLDIDMPGLSGLEALELMPEATRPVIVLSTAHSEHAIAAFDLGATDYLLKPVEAARLLRALSRARERLGERGGRAPDVGGRAVARLAIATKNGIELVDPARVSHAVLEGELVTIVTLDGELLSDEPLADLLARLPAERFERVHRRALLNLEHVTRLEPAASGGYVAHMRSGHAVEVSRQAARDLRRRLGVR